MSDNLRAINMDSFRLGVLTACALIGATSLASAEAQVRVRLKDGGFVAGAMANNAAAGSVAVESPAFKSPIELEVSAIRSIDQLDRNQAGEPTKQSFIFSGGSELYQATM